VEINGKGNALYRAENVVALEHARTVSGRLANLDVPVLERHKSEALGLGLLVLHEDGLKRAADRVVDALLPENRKR
jgi:hypothetical protein